MPDFKEGDLVMYELGPTEPGHGARPRWNHDEDRGATGYWEAAVVMVVGVSSIITASLDSGGPKSWFWGLGPGFNTWIGQPGALEHLDLSQYPSVKSKTRSCNTYQRYLDLEITDE